MGATIFNNVYSNLRHKRNRMYPIKANVFDYASSSRLRLAGSLIYSSVLYGQDVAKNDRTLYGFSSAQVKH
jgi:hypothetical protein